MHATVNKSAKMFKICQKSWVYFPRKSEKVKILDLSTNLEDLGPVMLENVPRTNQTVGWIFPKKFSVLRSRTSETVRWTFPKKFSAL